jgi:hypothetical protein
MTALLLAMMLAAARPALVGKGVVSSTGAEASVTLTPDGNELYFTFRSPVTTTVPLSVICVSRKANGAWQKPEVAPFSGRWFDSGPYVSPDGRKLFFASNRPIEGDRSKDADIWFVERTASGWSEPHNAGAPVNGPATDQTPAVAGDGTLYFSSSRPGGKGGFDLYCARFVEGRYQEPQALTAVNTEFSELTPYVTADETLLLFASIGRPDEILDGGAHYPRGDLYVSLRQNGEWTAPRHLDPPINSPAAELAPFLAADGKTLYFMSERSPFLVPRAKRLDAATFQRLARSVENGKGNLYSIPWQVPAVRQTLGPR